MEAPFRAVRLVLFGFFAASASVGAVIALTQVLGAALGGDTGKITLADAGQSLGIDLACAGGFAFLLKRDLDARTKQMARLGREAALGALRVRLANGRRSRLASLRGFARPVLVAGTRAQVDAAMAAAEPHRDALLERGVMVVPAAVLGEGEASDGDRPDAGDLRWRAAVMDAPAWRAWFVEQAASVGTERGLFVGLRIDGRVRASGVGVPPWATFVAQLPPTDGVFSGFLDGMDGKVGER